ncbi:ribosomal L7Ae/L30e/S12e/Gadd45 family protein [Gemella sp. GH3]|uniref:L7Ae/L30e/S12e/Gadd45 family ribosomal protein n=1 Tax=unclassified Gemella TaxID=2624949 RepID=UPI0015D02E79|nr:MULTISPECIES: ribosomal L7Ae/L30e/S12e/Gadd45 family protein [unclassified Gemella]MBF0714464.1 ribosomal L7Ae/L30e/S12e/Gadd45 family protein [Gemella sp. GH3.1]NYS51416.1 ribosomal L7Ae/L30e/S12e/Gadd45 family protein [Gemella sp. GH3]
MKKALNLLGLMVRAGKVVTGEDLIIKSIREDKLNLLLIAIDCGKNTTKKLCDKAEYYNVKVLTCFTTEEISNAIGKNNRVAIGITDIGFSRKLVEIVNQGGFIDDGKD